MCARAHRATGAGLRGESGFTLFTLLVALSVMAILLSVAVERWSSIMRREREEELIFRGEQIVGGIRAYQRKLKAYPPSLKVLVDQKFLRKLYKDPMTEKGQWNLILFSGGGEKSQVIIPDPDRRSVGEALQIVGVCSPSKDKSARDYNGATTYDKWIFTTQGDKGGRRGGGKDQGDRPPRGDRPRHGGQEEEGPPDDQPPDGEDPGDGTE